MNILNKFVICDGCRKKTTISYKKEDNTKIAKCSFCLKITEHQIKPKKKDMENSTDQFIREYLEWYKPIVKNMNVFLSIPNEYSKLPNLKENAIYLNLFEKVNQNIDAKKYMLELLAIADSNNINLYLEPIPRYKYITNEAKKSKITREYLTKYYENFGFKMTDWDWMERIYINKN